MHPLSRSHNRPDPPQAKTGTETTTPQDLTRAVHADAASSIRQDLQCIHDCKVTCLWVVRDEVPWVCMAW